MVEFAVEILPFSLLIIFPSNKCLSRAHSVPGSVSARVAQTCRGAHRLAESDGFAHISATKASHVTALHGIGRWNCFRICFFSTMVTLLL